MREHHKERIEAALDAGCTTLHQIAGYSNICTKTVYKTCEEFPDLHCRVFRMHEQRLAKRAVKYIPIVKQIDELRAEGMPLKKACARAGVNHLTYYRYRDYLND